MRVQLGRLRPGALAVALAAAPALAQSGTTVTSKVQVYADTDRTIVVSPHVTAATTTDAKTVVGASYTEDVISSASVDVRSAASPRIYDRRQEVDVSVGQDVAGTQVGASVSHSRERDYLSTGGAISLSRELNRRNTAVELRLGHMSNLVGRSGDPSFEAPMTNWSADLALTQTFTPTTVGQLNATAARADGFLASPYRRVRIGDGEFALPEATPPNRMLFAAAVAVKQYLPGRLVGHLDYRFYADTFALMSHTVDGRIVLDLDELTIRLRYRLYLQNGAFFYEARYDRPRLYLSADRELSPFSSHLFGVKLEWAPPRLRHDAPGLRLDAKAEAMYFLYRDFPSLPSRWALITQAGFSLDL